MGTDYAPLYAALVLFCYERAFKLHLRLDKQSFITDALIIHDDIQMNYSMSIILFSTFSLKMFIHELTKYVQM